MDSIIMQKQVRDNAKDLQDFCKDLKEWGDEMKKKDETLKRSKTNSPEEVPLSRNKISKMSKSNMVVNENGPSTSKQSKRIQGIDYGAWDKFDADAYCAKLDEEADENSSPESELSDEIDETAIDLANSEKEKGNAFVKKQQWDQAIDCYTKAIEGYAYDPIYYANRALCYLKKEKYQNAESDCTTALQLDKTYVKAYQRRAAAREKLSQISEAHSDLLKVLELEPKNKESQGVLLQIEKKLEKIKQINPNTIEEQRPVSKFTLSRQKHKDSTIELQPKSVNKVSAFAEHVVEREASSSSNISKEQIKKVNSLNSTHASTSDNADMKSNYANTIAVFNDVLLAKHDVNNIQLYKNIYKTLKTRSKKPLKRIQIIDVDLQSENQYFINKKESNITVIKENRSELFEKGVLETKSPTKHYLEKKIVETKCARAELEENERNKEKESDENISSFMELNLPIPKTSVQFYNSWKSISRNKVWCKLYLLKLKPNDLPIVFKESLESKVFSEILEIIGDNIKSDILLVDYLLALIQVKRFGALVMFMSSKDKKCVSNIVEYLKQNTHYTNIDIDNIFKAYEL